MSEVTVTLRQEMKMIYQQTGWQGQLDQVKILKQGEELTLCLQYKMFMWKGDKPVLR